MAKTNWQLNEIVMPADMNQIGTEINEKVTMINSKTYGTSSFENQNFSRQLGTRQTIANSPNQKVNITLPAGINFNGLFFVDVYGNYGNQGLLGKVTKVFTGIFNGSNLTFGGLSHYEEVYGTNNGTTTAPTTIQIGEPFTENGAINIPICYSFTLSTSIMIAVRAETSSPATNLRTFMETITLGQFYPSSTVLPKAYEQKNRLELTSPQGTAPLVVTSTTRVDNLNPELWNGWRSFDDVISIGLNNTSSLKEILEAMPVKSLLRIAVTSSNRNALNLLSSDDGFLIVTKYSAFVAKAENVSKLGSIKTAKIDSLLNFNGWSEVSSQGSPISSTQLTSTAPQGTAPLVVTSTTKVDNLNVERLNGLRYYQSPTEFGVDIGNENEENIALGMANDSILIFRKTNANPSSFYPDTPGTLKVIKKGNTGVSFAFTTQKNVSPPVFVRYEASYNNEILTASRWTGWKKVLIEGESISSSQLISTAPQGTAPLVVTSTTRVDNLNPELWGGWRVFNSLSQLGIPDTSTMQQTINQMPNNSKLFLNINSANSANFQLTGYGVGLLELTKFSTSRAKASFYDVEGEFLDGLFNTSLVFIRWQNTAHEGTQVSFSKITSTAPQGTTPLVVTSNTKVDNLNSDLVDGMHADVNKTANTIVARKSDGGINTAGFSSFEQIGVKLPGRNRELRLTQDANNISYIQLVNDSGGFISNPIQINSDGTAGLNVSTNVISYTNPATPQVRNTHVGNTAPSNSLGINGDIYIEL